MKPYHSNVRLDAPAVIEHKAEYMYGIHIADTKRWLVNFCLCCIDLQVVTEKIIHKYMCTYVSYIQSSTGATSTYLPWWFSQTQSLLRLATARAKRKKKKKIQRKRPRQYNHSQKFFTRSMRQGQTAEVLFFGVAATLALGHRCRSINATHRKSPRKLLQKKKGR